MTKKIYIFRHGSTDWNVQGRFQGHRNIPLNEEGYGQAKKLRPFFVNKSICNAYSSDLSRAQETAIHALGWESEKIKSQINLREINLGEAEGLTKEQIIEKFGEESWGRWIQQDPHFLFRGGESKFQALQRMTKAIHEIAEISHEKTIAICTHGFVLRLFLTEMGHKIDRIANCQLFEINYIEGQFIPVSTHLIKV